MTRAFLSAYSLVKQLFKTQPGNCRLKILDSTRMRRQKCEPKFERLAPPCEHQGPAESHSSEYKQMASKPTRTAKGWPLRPVKKYKDICHSYKLTSGPVVLWRVTTAQRSGGTVTETIPIGWCVGEYHIRQHHFSCPLFSCSLILSSQSSQFLALHSATD